jgi:heat shock protein HslJ
MGVTASIEFHDDGTVSFNSGCNSGGGGYTVDGDTLTFSNLVTTEMACPGPQSDVEATFLGVLGAESVDFVIDSDQLTLLAAENGLQFTAG